MSNHNDKLNYTDKFLIRDLNTEERPREKAMSHGIKSLSDAELMAIIFGTGVQGQSVLTLSRNILKNHDGHLSRVARKDYRELIKDIKGIGPAKAISLLAALELGARASADALSDDRTPINSSEKAFAYMRRFFVHLNHEEFYALFLTQALKPIRCHKIGQGGLTATLVDHKIILKEALLCNASAVILFHNHPSGNLQPSLQDKQLTNKVKEACNLLSIRLNDHLIITDGSYYSFNDQGLL